MTAWLISKAKILGLAACGTLLLALAVTATLYSRECGKTENLRIQLSDARFANDHKDLLIGSLQRNVSGFIRLMQDGEAALADARKSALERAEIVRNAKTTAPKGGRKVIDDATRKKVADRLNRPLP